MRGVFFDLYGTLLVYEDMARAWADWRRVFHGSLRERGLADSEATFAERTARFFEEPAPPRADDGLTEYERRIVRFGRDSGLSLSPSDAARIARDNTAAWQRSIPLDPEARPLLETLTRRGCALALITNFDHPPHVHRVLRDHALAPLFGSVVISGSVGLKKPDPRIFELALAPAGLDPAQAVFVGDAAEDVDGARAAGLRAIAIARNGAAAPPDADATIGSLAEVAELVP